MVIQTLQFLETGDFTETEIYFGKYVSSQQNTKILKTAFGLTMEKLKFAGKKENPTFAKSSEFYSIQKAFNLPNLPF